MTREVKCKFLARAARSLARWLLEYVLGVERVKTRRGRRRRRPLARSLSSFPWHRIRDNPSIGRRSRKNNNQRKRSLDIGTASTAPTP